MRIGVDLLEVGGCLRMLAEPQEHDRAVEARLGKLRIERERGVERGERLRVLALHHQRKAAEILDRYYPGTTITGGGEGVTVTGADGNARGSLMALAARSRDELTKALAVNAPARIDIRDEGTSQGRVGAVDFTGTGVAASVSGDLATITISGSGFAAGATVAFENGSGGPAPRASNVVVVNATTITATFTAGGGGPQRNRVWDVRVTNPDGSFGVKAGGLMVTP